ncbi:MAG: glycosyltransferase family 9 protein [Melioribacteraceae bacterium]|nr:glycosyltransferase family 9 protein [Melioribacteraceae bacterium]
MKILVIQTAFLGDAILTLPLIQKLKSKYSESIISVIAIPASKDIFNASEFVNETIVFDKKGNDRSLKAVYDLFLKIRSKKFDQIYSPHRSFRSSLMVLFSGCKETYGFNTSSLSFVYKYLVEYKKDIHEVARNLYLGGFDISGDNWKIFPDIKISPVINKKIEYEIKNNFKNEYITIALGSVWATKKYPIEYYREVALHFISRDYSIALIGGKEDVKDSESISKELGNKVVSFAGKLSLIESIALINESKVLICNDSAPTHLGMATTTPVLTIYCSTIRDFGFYPYADNSIVLSYDNLECKPCGIHGRTKCPLDHFNCGFKLTPQFVIDMISKDIINKKLN